jgi:hypothetical protein
MPSYLVRERVVERILISNAATVAMEGNAGESISGILHLQSS